MPASFKSEKELCDYLEINIQSFALEILGEPLVSYKRESYLGYRAFGANKPRIDFELFTPNKRVLVECKNPTNVFGEITRAISQLLTYGAMAGGDCELVLVTSKTLPIVQQTILRYNLPIKVVYLTKDVLAEWDIDFEAKLNTGVIQVENQYAIS